jgi:hypothetical protein
MDFFGKKNKQKTVNQPQVPQADEFNYDYVMNIQETTNLSDVSLDQYIMLRDSDKLGYRTHEQQVDKLVDMYDAESRFGCELTKSLINLSSSASLPNGLQTTTEENFESEAEYIKQFIAINNLQAGTSLDLVRAAELQGQVLVKLVWDNTINNVRLDYIPWDETHYKINSLNDNSKLAGPFLVDYKDSKGNNIVLNDDEICFVLLNNRLGKLEGRPKLGGVINILIGVSQDIEKFHQIIHVLTHPTVHIKAKTAEGAKRYGEALVKKGWKMGSILIDDCEVEIISASGIDVDKLYQSITTHIKLLCACCGIDPINLGWVDLASNQASSKVASAQNDVESYASISKWNLFYQQLFDKVIAMRNQYLKNIQLTIGKVHPCLVTDSVKQAQFVKDIAMPAAVQGLLSKKAFLENIPGIDIQQELQNQEAEKADMPTITEEPYPEFNQPQN